MFFLPSSTLLMMFYISEIFSSVYCKINQTDMLVLQIFNVFKFQNSFVDQSSFIVGFHISDPFFYVDVFILLEVGIYVKFKIQIYSENVATCQNKKCPIIQQKKLLIQYSFICFSTNVIFMLVKG